MYKAVDKEGNIITLSTASNNNQLYCRCCHSPVYYVAGDISCKYGKSSHFRHFPKCKCDDDWHHDKTQWHRDWQNCFPIENQEIILEKGGKKHIADVALPDSRVVVEFQHSHISPTEFEDRNGFYTGLGFRVIWVFDVQNQYSQKRIGISERGYAALLQAYYWDSPVSCLRNYELSSCVDIFLQVTGFDNDTRLIRVSRSDAGFKLLFAPSIFFKDDFLEFAYSPDDLKKYRFHHSKEELEHFGDLKFKGMDCSGRKTVLGCPLAESGSEVFVEECRQCQFHSIENGKKIGCLKHYLSLPIAEEINAGHVYRDNLEQAKGIELSSIPNERLFTTNTPDGETIDRIWSEYSSAGVMILLNLHSGSEIKMCKSWYLEGRANNNYKCEIRMKGHQYFMKDRRQVIYPEKKQFAVLWWKEPTQ